MSKKSSRVTETLKQRNLEKRKQKKLKNKLYKSLRNTNLMSEVLSKNKND